MQLPNLQLKHVIGRGAHGTVHLAHHNLLRKPVAVKLVPDNTQSQTEALMLIQMQSFPHMVRYLEHGSNGKGMLYIVMDMCNGITVGDLIHHVRHGSIVLTEKQVRILSECIAYTLLHCHEAGMMYGDVKPDNMIFTDDQNLVMIDTGSVRYGDNFERPLGTPLFFAPEKFAHDYGRASDVWSMGVVMYMLVCGHHPFVHTPMRKDYYGLVELNIELEATPLAFHHPHWDHVSDDMKDMLRKILRKDKHRRLTIEEALTHRWWYVNM